MAPDSVELDSPRSTAGRRLRREWPMRVELSRQDIHAGDTHGLQRVVDVPDQMRLSELLVRVIEPFVPQVPGLTWTCRAKVRDEWVDVAETGSVDGQPNSRLLIEDDSLAAAAAAETGLPIGCWPIWAGEAL
jgi:hypothetical protein